MFNLALFWLQPRSMELYRTLGVLEDILREHIPVPEIRTCELGSGFSQVISVFNTSPYMAPTPECPYVSLSFFPGYLVSVDGWFDTLVGS